MVFGAAEAVVFLLIPLTMAIGLVVSLVTGGEEAGSMFGGLVFFGVIAVISYYFGFMDSLFELIAKIRS
jgi:hypothetical protein